MEILSSLANGVLFLSLSMVVFSFGAMYAPFSPSMCYFLAKTLPGTELSAVGVGHGDHLMRKWNNTQVQTSQYYEKNMCA